MKLHTVQNLKLQTPFKTEPQQPETNPKEQEKSINKKEIAKISAAVLATALAATTITSIVKGKADAKARRRLEETYRNTLANYRKPLEDKIKNLRGELQTKGEKITELQDANKKATELNQRLRQEAEDAKDKLDNIFEGDLTPAEVRSKIYTDLKGKTDKAELGYDVMEPPVTGLGQKKVYEDAVDLPARVKTTNRAGMKPVEIPEIKPDGSFEFTMPTSSEIKLSHVEKSRDFKPHKNQMTNVSEGYADSVQWNNDKIARDILQNFFDGHGQTLDGVRFKFEPTGQGRYKVRIEGDSSYTADKAIFIGESTKREDMKAAGNYGEGLKMASLKLIRDKGAKDVKIGSDNWDLTFKLMENDLTDKQVMAFDLDKTAKKAGNYIEFKTDDKELLETLRKSINRFYHSGNEHFKTPDFENDIIGIKVLKQPSKHLWNRIPGEKGGIYIAGQRFEFNGDYDGLEGAVIFLKEKPPKSVLDPSRDRTTLNETDLRNIARWLCQEPETRMPKEDRIKFLNALEPLWTEKGYSAPPLAQFLQGFLSWQSKVLNEHKMKEAVHINFPADKYVAYSDATNELVEMLERKGYKVCHDDFAGMGMQTIKDLMGDARKHDPVKPTEAQMKKIAVLKDAIKKLAPALEKEHFSPQEIDTKIFLFNNTAGKEAKIYSSTLAEAIVDGAGPLGKSKGFWIDRNYLDTGDFSEVLETALHEMSHKVGGDESMEFSYKLTDVNKESIKQILNDPKTRNELRALNKLWNEYTDAATVV